jgi:hypothetical protein
MQMDDDAYLKGIVELYQGEVLGEVVFDQFLRTSENDEQRYKIATMLQLETETKARLRPLVLRRGLELGEDPTYRAEGMAIAEAMGALPWRDKMSALYETLRDRFVPRYKEIAAMAPPEDADVTASMVEHESALLEMARREVSGMADRSVESVVALLKYPLPPPKRAA